MDGYAGFRNGGAPARGRRAWFQRSRAGESPTANLIQAFDRIPLCKLRAVNLAGQIACEFRYRARFAALEYFDRIRRVGNFARGVADR
jgi:hypothetical protein